MRALIITLPVDPHGVCVAAALARAGHSAVVWAQPGDLGAVKAAVTFSEGDSYISTQDRKFSLDEFDVVWMRRHNYIQVPSWVVPDDKSIAAQEAGAMFRWMWGVIGRAHWIHGLADYIRSESKLLQLAGARRVGFKLPETLVGNDPDIIREFVNRMAESKGGAIYKTFFPVAWESEKTVRPVLTSRVSCDQLQDDEQLIVTPAIYQGVVDKKYEVRSTFFGRTEISVAINSQESAEGKLDWRDIDCIAPYLTTYVLPDDVREMCYEYMREFALDIACFDFIVDHDGNHVFLEANQQGQFLWVEEYLDECKTLRAATRLLIDRGGGSIPERWEELQIDAKDVYDSDQHIRMKQELIARHIVDTAERVR